MPKNRSVFGMYLSSKEAESAVNVFSNAGFTASDISVLRREKFESEEKPATDNNTKAPEAAVVGAGSGAAVGGALGWLLGIGALVIPGIGPVLAAGPIVTVLAGIGVGGAIGGFAGCLVGVGIPEQEAKIYEGTLKKGGVLVAAHCESSDDLKRAESIMKRTGAKDVAASGELKSSEFKSERQTTA